MLLCYFFGLYFFFFNDTATTEIYTLSLHDALPISGVSDRWTCALSSAPGRAGCPDRHRCASSALRFRPRSWTTEAGRRSEEHTSELQSRQYLVCRLLLEKKKNKKYRHWRMIVSMTS